VTNLRLPGQYDERLLGSLGLQGPYYNWNRWYLPSVGRYLELDPIAKEGAFNTPLGVDWYGYASGNPMRFIDPNGWKITSNINQGPDQLGVVTCTHRAGSPGGACLAVPRFTTTPCRKVDCSYKYDASVNVSIWRQFISRRAMGGPSDDSPGLTLAQHENLHLGDYRNDMGSGALDAAYQSEGFSTLAECESKRAGLQAFLDAYTDAVVDATGWRDAN
jgi:RHS repeat-associated protein